MEREANADAETPADADADADAEETVDEEAAARITKTKKKRKLRRSKHHASGPVPGPSGASQIPSSPAATFNPRIGFRRRKTTANHVERSGLSEGEGRERLMMRRGYAPGVPSGETRSIAETEVEPNTGAETDFAHAIRRRRRNHFRSMTTLAPSGTGTGAGLASDFDGLPRRPFLGAHERAATFGAAKWQQMKNTLRSLRPSKEKPFEYLKSAELLAELGAGAPAVLMFASMIQRDEHGRKRIPVLLEQLNLRISDSRPMDEGDDRHWIFTIALEYGNGPYKMSWSVQRNIREILNLHFRYKLNLSNDKYILPKTSAARFFKQPKFPLSSFPYLRNVRGLDDSDNDDEPAVTRPHSIEVNSSRGGEPAVLEPPAAVTDVTAGEHTASDGENRPPPVRKKSRMHMLPIRRSTIVSDRPNDNLDVEQLEQREVTSKRRFIVEQRRVLEKYLQDMIRWLIFRADSNRLCKFFELSALGVRLAAEGTFRGKECYLHIHSSNSLGIRRMLHSKVLLGRSTRKWFLVRQSYVVCVESPENMEIHDVYLVDSSFRVVSKRNKLQQIGEKTLPKKVEIDLRAEQKPGKHHNLTLYNSSRKVRLFSGNLVLVRQFEESIKEMLVQTDWNKINRFGSYAPVRHKVHAQWLIDGRDYMWNVSRALNMAKDVIYIHDWWLSPELYMRRPPAISQKWRLDRILQRKAAEGVKVFVIIYRNVEAAVPIDSEYTKYSLLNLHPNIFVQRSPHQFKKTQFFYAHHEKMVVVDHDIAFVGGVDLCYGRWDCPQHPVADDKPTGFEDNLDPRDVEHCQLFPGKDYSNPRVADFVKLHEPYAEMYDRTTVPRMPWHDVAMQVVGQPARDLTRHFVERWNYIRRGRNPTRPTPYLLPPPDLRFEDMEALGLTGTCEVQMLRSACNWSLGIETVESSIHTAYVRMIEESEHFVYIENQFFITTCSTLGYVTENLIGDAIVERAKRAHANGEDWKCIIVIPLVPGFITDITGNQGSSARIILQLQYRSICRGENSIFGRLRLQGIDPEEYIYFSSLRQWGKFERDGMLTTEQLYIHAKLIIVDDRVALIGSANINERSMLGDRDSELACIVRDTDMIESRMGGQPYLVGRFAHSMRMRLMREHLGLDVDEILEQERMAEEEDEEDEERHRNGSHYNDDSDEAEEEVEEEEVDEEGLEEEQLPQSAHRVPHQHHHQPPVSAVQASGHMTLQDPPTSFNQDVELQDLAPSSRANEAKQHAKKDLGKNFIRDYTPPLALKQPPQQIQSTSDSAKKIVVAAKKNFKNSKGLASSGTEGRESVESSDSDDVAGSTDDGDARVTGNKEHQREVEGYGQDKWQAAQRLGLDAGRDSVVVDGREVLVHDIASEGRAAINTPTSGRRLSTAMSMSRNHSLKTPALPPQDRRTDEESSLPRPSICVSSLPVVDGADAGGPPAGEDVHQSPRSQFFPDMKFPLVDKDCMKDPIEPGFLYGIWLRVAENNTRIYRRVFRCQPDSEVQTFSELAAWETYEARFKQSMMQDRMSRAPSMAQHDLSRPTTSSGAVAPGLGVPSVNAAPDGRKSSIANTVGSISKPGVAFAPSASGPSNGSNITNSQLQEHSHEQQAKLADGPAARPGTSQTSGTTRGLGATSPNHLEVHSDGENQLSPFPTLEAITSVSNQQKQRRATFTSLEKPERAGLAQASVTNLSRRRTRATTRASRHHFTGQEEVLSKDEAEEMLNMLQGSLVEFAYDWLYHEEHKGMWLHGVDTVSPLAIYS